jgi:hypothetical protein
MVNVYRTTDQPASQLKLVLNSKASHTRSGRPVAQPEDRRPDKLKSSHTFRRISVVLIMASTDDDTLTIVGLLIAMKSKDKRKMWCEEWLQKRNTYSHVNFHKQNSL